jgi:hypothetical protein
VDKSESFGLTLNTSISKTKIMVFSKKHNPVVITAKGIVVEQVSVFKYLGTLVDERCNAAREIQSRIEQARTTFTAMKKFFISKEVSLKLRLRMIQC